MTTLLLMASLPTMHKWDETIYEGKLLFSLKINATKYVWKVV